jgi:hypothetical protein
LANASAVARPNPDAPPTITAFLPAISIWHPFRRLLSFGRVLFSKCGQTVK